MLKLGDILLCMGVITEEQLAIALCEQKKEDKRLGEYLVEHFIISEPVLTAALARQYGYDVVDLKTVKIDYGFLHSFDKSFLTKHLVIPYEQNEERVFVALADPLDFEALQKISSMLDKKATVSVANKTDVEVILCGLN